MGKRGPKPRGAAYHQMVGNYRPRVHGPLSDGEAEGSDMGNPITLSGATTPSELSEEADAARKRDIADFRRALYGEAGPPDPGPRSGGSAKRIRW